MNTLQNSYRGFSLMLQLNADRLINLGAIAVALLLASYLGLN